MARASIEFVLILVCMNIIAGMVTAAGVGAALDINPEIAQDEQIDDTAEAAENIQPGGGVRDTLQGLYQSVTQGFEPVFNFLFYGPVMLSNLGIPWYFTEGLVPLITIISAIDIVYALTGRQDL